MLASPLIELKTEVESCYAHVVSTRHTFALKCIFFLGEGGVPYLVIRILDNIGTRDDLGGLRVGGVGEGRGRQERRGQTKTNHDE